MIRMGMAIAGIGVLAAGLISCANGYYNDDERQKVNVPAAPRNVDAFAYDCEGGQYVVVAYDKATDRMCVFLPGKTAWLDHVRSGSGARYSDGEITYWNKGNEATIELPDGTLWPCVESKRKSVIESAKLSGADFWGIGNEPGWMIKVYPDRMEYVGDYGETIINTPLDFQGSNGVGDAFTWLGEFEGRNIEIIVYNRPCNDGMSGEAFPATITIQIGDQLYRGCGQALH